MQEEGQEVIPVAVVAKYLPTFLAAAERLAALWLRFRRRGKAWPRVERPRPLQGPPRGEVTIWEVVAVTFVMGVLLALFGGCAALGGASAPGESDIASLRALCDEVMPCAPCPPTPVCPPPPVCPEPAPGPEEPKDESCDREGLPPDWATVWKPISDGTGTLAIVTGADLECKGGVRVKYGKRWMKVEHARTPAADGERANGCRLAWRYSRTGAAFGRNVKVECLDAAGRIEREWRVPDGARRTEFRGR